LTHGEARVKGNVRCSEIDPGAAGSDLQATELQDGGAGRLVHLESARPVHHPHALVRERRVDTARIPACSAQQVLDDRAEAIRDGHAAENGTAGPSWGAESRVRCS